MAVPSRQAVTCVDSPALIKAITPVFPGGGTLLRISSLRTLTVASALLTAAAAITLSQAATAASADNGLAHRAVKVCATPAAGAAACHA
jgi:hypothetical protein